ncbi:UNKNOWN [Stylonychia lemnae]|uniref:Uncharacterized protein n=1 Tax=Stylonychia lemnae TaxID=5949 RepID=A0A077ZSA8_STYLE|nr:UNKNOWN [Stylonychia lemnae]|eukprot:CDW72409.1 UNKNOWN [Stylonychia lemnae]
MQINNSPISKCSQQKELSLGISRFQQIFQKSEFWEGIHSIPDHYDSDSIIKGDIIKMRLADGHKNNQISKISTYTELNIQYQTSKVLNDPKGVYQELKSFLSPTWRYSCIYLKLSEGIAQIGVGPQRFQI